MKRPERWTLLHLATLGGVLAFVTLVARGQWFFGDEWDFISFRGITGTHKFGLWTPHNEHWSTIPILLWRAIFHFVGIGSYWPYMFLLFGAHLLCMHFVWQILRRMPGVSPPLAIAGALVMGLFGAGWEDLLWAFQIGFVGSLAFGLGLVAAIDRTGSRRRVIGVAIGAVLSLMMSGISVVMVGVVGLTAFAKWGWRKALVVSAPAGVVYLAWFERYAKPSLEAQEQLHGTISDVPRYVVGGVGGTLGLALNHQSWGSALLVLLALVTAWKCRRWFREAPEVLALAIGAVALYAVISQGRGALLQPATPRYLYISGGLLIPAVVVALGQAAQGWRVTRNVVVIAMVGVALTGAQMLAEQGPPQKVFDLHDKGQFIAAEQLAATGIHIVSDQPQSPFNPDLTLADVASLRKRGKSFDYPITDRDRAAARLALQVGSSFEAPEDRALGNTTAPKLAAVTLTPRPNGCMQVDPHGVGIEVRTNGASAFSIRAKNAGRAELYLAFADGFVGPRYVDIDPHKTTTVVSDLTDRLIIQALPGTVEMCGITWE